MLFSEELAQVRGPLQHFVIRSLSFVKICRPHSQLTNCSTTPYRLSSKAYSTYLQLPSIHGGRLLHLQHFFVTPNNSQTRLSEKDDCCTWSRDLFPITAVQNFVPSTFMEDVRSLNSYKLQKVGEQPLNNG